MCFNKDGWGVNLRCFSFTYPIETVFGAVAAQRLLPSGRP